VHRTCRIADFGSGSVWITLAILAALLLETPHGGVSLADLAAIFTVLRIVAGNQIRTALLQIALFTAKIMQIVEDEREC
jgi:hypothetical protein